MKSFLCLSGMFLMLLRPAYAVSGGEVIYLKGADLQGNPIPAVLNDLRSDSALACVNCHRESGYGSSESGQTFPPVSWSILSKNQPETEGSRFYSIQNKRKAYDPDSFFKLLTSGINSNGVMVDKYMPKYALTREQSLELIDYLKTIGNADDPGVDKEVVKIATILDERIPVEERANHIKFLNGLFEMKNALTRGELKRKKHSPIQKVPQYESFRKWELVVWELPPETRTWTDVLNQKYQEEKVFTVLRPLVLDGYQYVSNFCTQNKLSCLFPSGRDLPNGDFYNFVFRNRLKQQKDYISNKIREDGTRLFYLNDETRIEPVTLSLSSIPYVEELDAVKLKGVLQDYCQQNYEVLVNTNLDNISDIESISCPNDSGLKLLFIANDFIDYDSIVNINNSNKGKNVCWVSDYNKALNRNYSKVRVDTMTRRFGIVHADGEEMAATLLAYGLLSDTFHKMAGNFSRRYMMEIMEHMLNSFPNYTYYSAISGAPYQRFIVGPLGEYCSGSKNL